ncbi:MAG TPA: TolC family protein [Kofleriaceae bacterium]
MKGLVALLVVATVASCAPALPAVPKNPAPALPSTFGGASEESAARIPWRELFTEPALAALISEALSHNTDLEIALQRIELARASVFGASGARLPTVALSVGAGVRRFGDYTMDGAGNAATEIRPGERVPENYTELSLGLQATWEIDLWKRYGALSGAARARYLASVEGANLVVTTLVAQVATDYMQLVAFDRTRDILAQSIERQEEALSMMRVEKSAGRANELAVKQFEGQLFVSRVLLARATQERDAQENELDAVVGRPPQPITRAATALDAEAAPLSAGLPAELLANRPDVRAAEQELAASQFDVRSARAAFYPHVQISAGIGYAAFDPRFLFRTPASIVYNLAAGLIAPLVNRRGIESAFAAASALQKAALFRYQGVVLKGVAEVATALGAVTSTNEIVQHQESRRDAMAGSVDVADALFRAGKATYLEVLLAQQNTRDAELELVTARRDHQLARIQLYRALGGGWRSSSR